MANNQKKLSNRERLKQLNKVSLLDESKKDDNIINVQLQNYAEHAEESPEKEIEIEVEQKEEVAVEKTPEKTSVPTEESVDKSEIQEEQITVQPQEKQAPTTGRPKKYQEPTKWIKIQLTETNYRYVKEHGWEYDGMNGFINHLIDESRNNM